MVIGKWIYCGFCGFFLVQMQCYAHEPLSQRIIHLHSRHIPAAAYTCPRGSYHTWNESEAKSRGYTYRRAAAMYEIPTSTLFDHMGAQPGPKPYLNTEEEEELASFLVQTAKIGYPHTKCQLFSK